jgi:hypothetical protein
LICSLSDRTAISNFPAPGSGTVWPVSTNSMSGFGSSILIEAAPSRVHLLV